MGEQEQLYDSLNKALKSSLTVIKYAIYPITVILFIILAIGIWWGVDLKSAKQDIDNIKAELNLKAKDVELSSKNLELSSKDLDYKAKESFRNLDKQFRTLETDFDRVNREYQKLQARYSEALLKNDELFKALKADSRKLEDFSNEIKKSISKYSADIEWAQKGVEQRKKDIELVLQKRNEQLEAVQQSIVLLTEYLLLVQAGRSTFPDPNLQREIDILNQMFVVLIPDSKQRNIMIQRILESINKK